MANKEGDVSAVTAYVEEQEGDVNASAQHLSSLTDETPKVAEVLNVQVRQEDVKALMEELELSRDKCDFLLRASAGSLKLALANYIQGKLV